MASDKILNLSGDNFDNVINGDQPVLVDFWAAWCGPCRRVAPILDQLADEHDGKLTIGKVDVDSNQDLAVKFGVQSIPTFILFEKGEVKDRVMGALPKGAFDQLIEKHVGAAVA